MRFYCKFITKPRHCIWSQDYIEFLYNSYLFSAKPIMLLLWNCELFSKLSTNTKLIYSILCVFQRRMKCCPCDSRNPESQLAHTIQDILSTAGPDRWWQSRKGGSLREKRARWKQSKKNVKWQYFSQILDHVYKTNLKSVQIWFVNGIRCCPLPDAQVDCFYVVSILW